MTSGMIVRSIAGRDKGRLHIVLAVDKEFVLIADGKWRKVQSPKRKKRKHVQPIDGVYIEDVKITNKHMRKIIAAIGSEIEEGELCPKKM